MIRPITENVLCGSSNRNPSNIMNILAFLNVRMQCNIRGGESQCFAGGETQSLQCVQFYSVVVRCCRIYVAMASILRCNLGRLLYDLIIL